MSVLLPTTINKHWTKELLVQRIEAEIKDHKEKTPDIPEGRLHSAEAHYDSSQIMIDVNLANENGPVFQIQTK
ncbi:hypothetical protein AHAS_Ahas15G0209700 [Arachis hypogaea]